MELSRNSIREVAKGQLHRLPGYATLLGLSRPFRRRVASARYCYSVWLRHLVAARENGLEPKPRVVVELGPGDSLGAGIAALLGGAERYVVVDWVRYTSVAGNVDVFEALLELFESRAPIPGEDEFPNVRPKLASYAFPTDLIDAPAQAASARRIRQALAQPEAAGGCISYFAPYERTKVTIEGGADFVFSQAVMEHVDDPRSLYQEIHRWLRPGGIASHVVDYRCHGTSARWNGHWTYTDAAWRLIRGGRPYLLNRMSHSGHHRLLTESGLDVVTAAQTRADSTLLRAELAPAFRDLSDDDLETAGALFQAVKRD